MKRKLSTKGIAISIAKRDSGLDEGELHRRQVVAELMPSLDGRRTFDAS
jgi:hypothetical protein